MRVYSDKVVKTLVEGYFKAKLHAKYGGDWHTVDGFLDLLVKIGTTNWKETQISEYGFKYTWDWVEESTILPEAAYDKLTEVLAIPNEITEGMRDLYKGVRLPRGVDL